MSDETPWQPPSSSDNTSDAAPDVSPWSREASGTDAEVPVLPEPNDATPPPPVPTDTTDTTDTTDSVAPADPAPTNRPVPPAPPSNGRRPALVAIAACAIVAVGLAAIFAVRQFTGETAGGADTPEQLADELMAAIEGEDMLGMIDVMLPGERESVGEPMIDTIAELQRLEILSSDLDLSALAGFDIEIEQHTTTVDQLGVDDIVMLNMSADVVVTFDGDEVPIGDLITDRFPEDELAEMRGTTATETDTIDVSMAAVEHDGSWYLSLFYTLAEIARVEASVGELPAEGIGAVGADSPEGVVDLFVDQLESFDVRGMLQLLDPAEAEALQRYAPLFLPDAEAAIAAETDAIDIRVVDHEVRVEGDGTSRTLFIEGFTVEADIEGASLSAAFSDECISITYTDDNGTESIEQCASSPDTSMVEEMAGLEVSESVDAFVTAFTEAFSDMEPVGIELRQREGQWFVSPIATGSEAMLAVLRALDRQELDELIDLGEVAANDFLGMAFGMIPGSVDDSWATDEWVEDDWADTSDSMGGTGDLETTDDGEWTEYEESAVDKCYSIEGSTEATACFEEQIAAGAAEDWEMPVSLRAPECGLTDLLWTGDVYGLSDEAFTQAMAAAQPCFDTLVADGYDEFFVPYEVENVDCFEGRNPYQVSDEEYSDRVFDCAFGVSDDSTDS